jgi:DNA end-binding protein Ku
MAATRTLWTGSLVVGSLSVPVRMVGAGDSPTKVSFNQAHRCKPGTFTRINQKRICPSCERTLGKNDIVRVFEDAPGHYLEVTDADLATCEERQAHPTLEAVALIGGFNPLFIDTTAVLHPVGDRTAFETVTQALREAVAVCTVVLNKRTTTVMLQMFGDTLVVYLTRLVSLVDAMRGPEAPTAVVQANVLQLRRELNALPRSFDYNALVDHYDVAVQAMLEKKSRAQAKSTVRSALRPTRARRRA